MNCKGLNRQCVLPSMHPGSCKRAINEQAVAINEGMPLRLTSAKTSNRRDRKAYNDYMREYMKARRAGKKPAGVAYG